MKNANVHGCCVRSISRNSSGLTASDVRKGTDMIPDEKFDKLLEELGSLELVEEINRALYRDEADEIYDHIAQMHDIEFNED